MDDWVVGKSFVRTCDRLGAGDGAAVVLGCAALCDEDVVKAGGGVVVEVWAFWGAYSCAVVSGCG